MPTPKFNRVALQFMERINDPTTETGSPLIVQAGKVLKSTAKIETFVNRALMQLFNQNWQKVNGDKKLFAQLLPDLVKSDSITTAVDGTYEISSTKLRSLYTPLDLRKGTTPIDLIDASEIEYIETDNNALAPSATQLYCVHKQTILEFYPNSSFHGESVNISFIQLPVNDTDGSLFTSGGTYDIPYSDQWVNELSKIAAQIYFEIVGEQ